MVNLDKVVAELETLDRKLTRLDKTVTQLANNIDLVSSDATYCAVAWSNLKREIVKH